MKSNETIIKVENLTKVFKLPHERFSTVKQHFVNILNKKDYEKFKALNNVSFEVKKGEFFGIIGSNGSGKSTLLKVLAQIYRPTSGNVEIKGSLSPFIELGVGFNPELTARENVFLNAAILGLTKKQTEEKLDEIIKFAELENFIDQKLKNFSSGMQVRLAFSISIQADSDILLVDEVLAVGDSSFQQKCFDVFRDLKKKGKTIIFVSHGLQTVQEFCDRVLLIKKGEVKVVGDPNQAILEYIKLVTKEEGEQLKVDPKEQQNVPSIVRVTSTDGSSRSQEVFGFSEDINFKIAINNPTKRPINLGIAVYRDDNTYCYGTNTIIDNVSVSVDSAEINIKFQDPLLLSGSYYVIAAIFGKTDKEVFDFKQKATLFKIFGKSKGEGVVFIKHKWEL